jgi:hypothetical protein
MLNSQTGKWIRIPWTSWIRIANPDPGQEKKENKEKKLNEAKTFTLLVSNFKF